MIPQLHPLALSSPIIRGQEKSKPAHSEIKNYDKTFCALRIPFAGKSTLAKLLIKKYGFVRIALDEIKKQSGEENLQRVYDIYQNQIESNLKADKSVIIDTVAHKRENRDALEKIARENKAEKVVLYVDTPLGIVKDRWMQNRIKKERTEVSDKEFSEVTKNFEIPQDDENVIKISNNMNLDEICKLIET